MSQRSGGIEIQSRDITAYDEESRKLADVIQHIEERRTELSDRMPASAADYEAAEGIQKILLQNADSLAAALDQPYFGRLDYIHKNPKETNGEQPPSDDESPSKTIYLGISFIQGKDVFAWTAPVGKLWYTPSYEDGYTAPKGYIATRVDLKRHIKIRDRRLENVSDVFRRNLPTPPKADDTTAVSQTPTTEADDTLQDSSRDLPSMEDDATAVSQTPTTKADDALRESLSEGSGSSSHLQIIVETIEPDQYENIANVEDSVLIVQGAAGSGKSEIGLHRIAYLLSPFSHIPERERPTPQTTLFVGPSQAFLEYAADILPNLGLQENIARVKFSDWLIGKLSVRPSTRPRIWNDLLNFGELRSYDGRAETFKGSLAMADTIDKRVNALATDIRRACRRLRAITPSDKRFTGVSEESIRAALLEALPTSERGRHLNRRREVFIDRIAREIQYADNPRRRQPSSEEYDRIRGAVARWCDVAWNRIDFRAEYLAMLSDSESMPEDIAAALANSAEQIQRRGLIFDDSDIGALAHLDNLLNGTIESYYRHIVIDEAQDISPIEFGLLRASSANNWLTVLGDTAQRLTPYRGVGSWREIERVFGRSEIEVQRARRTYRANKQITRFNNRILRTFDANILAPIAFERDGHPVEYRQHRSAADMYAGVAEDLRRIRNMDGMQDATIAILVRDQRNINRFQEFCKERDINDITRIDQEQHSESSTVIARIPDAKGLEYDAVIVMGVNDACSDTLFNKKLLYLAVTRARHYLAIHWHGRRSEILGSISARGVRRYR